MRPSRRSNSSVSAYSRSGSSRFLRHVGEHRGHEAGLEGDVGPLRRLRDHLFELLGRERDQRFHAQREEVREPAIAEGPIVEVRPQRHDHPQAAVRIAHRRLEAAEEVPAGILVVDEGEDLLELVDHEHEL